MIDRHAKSQAPDQPEARFALARWMAHKRTSAFKTLAVNSPRATRPAVIKNEQPLHATTIANSSDAIHLRRSILRGERDEGAVQIVDVP